MRSQRGFALPALVAGALIIGGCGGSSTTKSDVIARGNAICAGALRQVRATPSPAGGAGSLAGLSDYLKQVMPIVDKEISDIGALPRPSRDRALLDRYIAAVAGTKAQYDRLAAAARNGDSTGVAQALAKRYGLSTCAAPTGTSVS